MTHSRSSLTALRRRKTRSKRLISSSVVGLLAAIGIVTVPASASEPVEFDDVVVAQNDDAGEWQFLDPVNGDETTIDFSATSCEDPSYDLFSPFYDAETSSLYFSFWYQYGASDSLEVYKLQDGECSVAFDVAPLSTDSSTGWREYFDKSDFDSDSRKAAFIIYSSRDYEWSNRFVVFDLDSGEAEVYEFEQPADNFSRPAMDIHIRGDEVAFLGRQASQSAGQFSVVTVDLGTAVDTDSDGVFELSIETLSSFQSGGDVGYPEISVSPSGSYLVGFGTSNATHWQQGGIWLFNKASSSYDFGSPDGVNLVQIWDQPMQWGGSFDIDFGISGDLYLATSDGLSRTFGDPLEADFRLLNSDSFSWEYGIAVANVSASPAPHADDRVIFFDRDSDWVIGDLNDEDADPAYPNWPGGDPSECTDQVATTFGYFIDTASESFYWLANPVDSSSPVTIEKLTTDGVCSTAFTLENPSGYAHEAYPITIDFDQQSRRAVAAVTSNRSGDHGVSGLDSYWNDKVGLLDIGTGTQRILELSVPANDGTFVPAGEVGPYWTNYIGFSDYVAYGEIEWLEISHVSIFGDQLWVAGAVGNNNTDSDYMDAVAKYDLSTMSANGSLYVPTLERFLPVNLSDSRWLSIAADDENVYLANYDWGYDPLGSPPALLSSTVYRIGEEDVEGTAESLEVVWGPTQDTESLGIDLGSSGNLYVFDSSGMWRSMWTPHGVWDFEQLVYSPKTDPADNLEISVVYEYVAPEESGGGSGSGSGSSGSSSRNSYVDDSSSVVDLPTLSRYWVSQNTQLESDGGIEPASTVAQEAACVVPPSDPGVSEATTTLVAAPDDDTRPTLYLALGAAVSFVLTALLMLLIFIPLLRRKRRDEEEEEEERRKRRLAQSEVNEAWVQQWTGAPAGALQN